MTKLDAFQQATMDLGAAPAEELSRHIEMKFGVLIPPSHVPLFRATLQFQKSGPGTEKSGTSACLADSGQ